jgi:hypothetical protein
MFGCFTLNDNFLRGKEKIDLKGQSKIDFVKKLIDEINQDNFCGSNELMLMKVLDEDEVIYDEIAKMIFEYDWKDDVAETDIKVFLLENRKISNKIARELIENVINNIEHIDELISNEFKSKLRIGLLFEKYAELLYEKEIKKIFEKECKYSKMDFNVIWYLKAAILSSNKVDYAFEYIKNKKIKSYDDAMFLKKLSEKSLTEENAFNILNFLFENDIFKKELPDKEINIKSFFEILYDAIYENLLNLDESKRILNKINNSEMKDEYKHEIKDRFIRYSKYATDLIKEGYLELNENILGNYKSFVQDYKFYIDSLFKFKDLDFVKNGEFSIYYSCVEDFKYEAIKYFKNKLIENADNINEYFFMNSIKKIYNNLNDQICYNYNFIKEFGNEVIKDLNDLLRLIEQKKYKHVEINIFLNRCYRLIKKILENPNFKIENQDVIDEIVKRLNKLKSKDYLFEKGFKKEFKELVEKAKHRKIENEKTKDRKKLKVLLP